MGISYTNRTYTERIIIQDSRVRCGHYYLRNFVFPEIQD